MKKYKEIIENEENILNEGLITGLAVERKINSLKSKIKTENDIGKKIDLLATALHYGFAGLLLQLNKKRR
jgi:hypothetical protein